MTNSHARAQMEQAASQLFAAAQELAEGQATHAIELLPPIFFELSCMAAGIDHQPDGDDPLPAEEFGVHVRHAMAFGAGTALGQLLAQAKRERDGSQKAKLTRRLLMDAIHEAQQLGLRTPTQEAA